MEHYGTQKNDFQLSLAQLFLDKLELLGFTFTQDLVENRPDFFVQKSYEILNYFWKLWTSVKILMKSYEKYQKLF